MVDIDVLIEHVYNLIWEANQRGYTEIELVFDECTDTEQFHIEAWLVETGFQIKSLKPLSVSWEHWIFQP